LLSETVRVTSKIVQISQGKAAAVENGRPYNNKVMRTTERNDSPARGNYSALPRYGFCPSATNYIIDVQRCQQVIPAFTKRAAAAQAMPQLKGPSKKR
jgi:hypothetical protein